MDIFSAQQVIKSLGQKKPMPNFMREHQNRPMPLDMPAPARPGDRPEPLSKDRFATIVGSLNKEPIDRAAIEMGLNQAAFAGDPLQRVRVEKHTKDMMTTFLKKSGITARSGPGLSSLTLSKKVPSVAGLFATENQFSQWLRTQEVEHSLAWAQYLLKANQALAISIADSKECRPVMRAIAKSIFFRDIPRGAKSRALTPERNGTPPVIKLMDRLYQKIIIEAGLSDPNQIMAALIAEQCGGMAVVVETFLASVYQMTLGFAGIILDGMEEAEFAEVLETLPPDIIEICKSIVAFGGFVEPWSLHIGHILSLSLDEMKRFCLINHQSKMALAEVLYDTECAISEDDLTARESSRQIKLLTKQLEVTSKELENIKKTKQSPLLKSDLDVANRRCAAMKSLIAKKDARIARLTASPGKPLPDEAEIDDTPEALPEILPLAPMTNEECLESLRAIKGVMVGGHAKFTSKIKAFLPGWHFFSADHRRVEDAIMIGAEAVVFFTSHASHPLTDSALRIVRLYNKPLIHASKVNPPAFLREVAESARPIFS